MRRFAVVQHTYSDFLGLVETQLERRDIGFTYIRPFLDDPLPGGPMRYDGLFLLGGAAPVDDAGRCPWAEAELRLIGAFRKAELPVVGFGFGALMIAWEAGGTPRREPAHRCGFVRARATPTGAEDPVARAADGREVLLLHHGDVALPEGLGPVLEDTEGRWLAIRPDARTCGLLFRPELKPGMLEDILMEAGHDPCPELPEVLGEARARWDGMQATTDAVVAALVTALGLMRERRKHPVFSLKVE